MAQICRINKTEVPVLNRILHGIFGCCKRYQSNYYDILRIPQNATQKEIKEAFIKLSKEMHPDSGIKGNHTDFVKLNEAYSVLCKKDSRFYYDMHLRSNGTTNYNSDFQYNRVYNFYDINEFQSKKPSTKDFMKATAFCLIVMIFGSIIQLLCITMWSDHKRHKRSKRTAQYEIQYQKSKELRKQLLQLEQDKLNFPDK